MNWLLALSLLFFLAGVLVWRRCLQLAPRADLAIRAQADAMVRERHAEELQAIADSRFETAQKLLAVVRRDRDMVIAASRHRTDDDEMLEALRGYESVVVGTSCDRRWVLLVPPDFPLEHWFPGAQKGVTQ